MKIEEMGNSITFSKEFDAPKETVFSMFKSPHIEEWWGPSEWPVHESHQDFRPGGKWHYSMMGPDEEEAWGLAMYEQIEEPNKIVYRDSWADENGNVDNTYPTGMTTIMFEENPEGRTNVTMHIEYGSEEDRKKMIETGMVEGIKETWGLLEQHLSSMQRMNY